jgi:mono/diheme cytochrome c family protein
MSKTNGFLRVVALACAAVALGGCERWSAESRAAAAGPEQWKLVERYCVDCHNAAELAGGVAFDALGPESIAAHAETFEKVVRKLRGHLMPPPKEPRPAEDDLWSFVSWLEGTLDRAGAERAPERVVLHRLNRKEYANAVRDLLDLEVDTASLLPQDEQAEGFDNIAAALQVSPSFIEQYLIAARSVALQAVGRPDARAGSTTYNAPPGNQLAHVPGLPLGTRGGILAEHYFPSDGEYVVDIADMAGHIWGNDMEFENTVLVTLDGKEIYRTVIGGDAHMKRYDQEPAGAFDFINATLKNIRFQATAGPHKLGVTFLRRTFAESDDRIEMFVPGGGQERVYRVSSFQVAGPFVPSGLSTMPSRERIFTCHPARGADAALCAEEIVTTVGSRAFRRPLLESDLTRLLQYYREGAAAGGFEAGIRSALTGILASPYFLYRGEHVPQDVAAGTEYRIDDLDLASKLSFFLWNTIPDDELRDAAARGELRDERALRAQVERMLRDERAGTLASNFVFQWLDMARLEEVEPDRAVFPYAAGAGDPRADYLKELELFARSLFDEDRSVLEFLTAKHTYVNERVALLYGIDHVKGEWFQRVELADSPRWGLLGKGAILMAAAYPNRTSPVLRGAFILEHITGTPPAAPPPNVEALPEDESLGKGATTVREKMAAHSTNPTCFSCHGVLDPLGFALENFDAVGTWRERDRFAGDVLDTSGQLPDGTQLNGPDDLRQALLRRPEQFVQHFTERLLTYALGRTLSYEDMPTVRGIVRDAEEDGYRFSTIVWAIVQSEPFRVRRTPATLTAGQSSSVSPQG